VAHIGKRAVARIGRIVKNTSLFTPYPLDIAIYCESYYCFDLLHAPPFLEIG
jgi:hypothetical protein